MPPVLLPRKGKFGLTDYEKMYCPDPTAGDIFDLRRVDRASGCLVVVRPDQYVAHVVPLDEHDALTDFFARILTAAESTAEQRARRWSAGAVVGRSRV